MSPSDASTVAASHVARRLPARPLRHGACYPRGDLRSPRTVILERDVIVLSEDGSVRSEVSAVVAQRPGARTVYAGREGLVDGARGSSIVIIDDEGRRDALDVVHLVKARSRDASVVYLAADHSTALEEEVRRAGASFYAVKRSRDGDLTRVIEALLARSHG